ncbi:Nucleoside transporter [Phaffia rhodozyma]|uniref:Nucleoside transporter n=1 Tax=Phaffia rhodozyma TaxID=264483 RepID=A0A0F7SN84_PHARH|nr:Nucleoside transporter [Phaffia rhodozyma]
MASTSGVVSSSTHYSSLSSEDNDSLSPSVLTSLPSQSIPFAILGSSILLPWSILISSFPYAISLLSPSSPLLTSLIPTLSLVSTLTNLFALGWLTYRAATASTTSLPSPSITLLPPKDQARTQARAIQISLVGLLLLHVLFLLAVLLVRPGGTGWGILSGLGIWTVGSMILVSYLQTNVMSYSSLFGPKEIGATQLGNGMIAITVSFVQVVTSFLGPKGNRTDEGSSMKHSTVVFVFVGILLLISALFVQKHLTTTFQHQNTLSSPSLSPSLPLPTSRPKSSAFETFKTNWMLNVAVFGVFAVTLSVFPAVTSTVRPVGTGWGKSFDVWVPIGFFLFNFGDCIGRLAVSFCIIRSHIQLLVASLLRAVIFIPLFLGCNVNPLGNQVPVGTHPWGDGVFLTGLVLLGLSNGWITSNVMILASSPSLNPQLKVSEQELASTIAVFSLVSGLVAGSGGSFVVGSLSRLQ